MYLSTHVYPRSSVPVHMHVSELCVLRDMNMCVSATPTTVRVEYIYYYTCITIELSMSTQQCLRSCVDCEIN